MTRSGVSGRGGTGAIALLPVLVLAALILAPSAGAAGPYEPNDAMLSPAGPLAIGQTYTAAIETPGDKDFFFFHVTSSPSAQVTIAVRNLGGSPGLSDVDATILNTQGTPLAALPYIERGEERVRTIDLPPQKYVLEVASKEGATDAYTITTGGSRGAFGSYGRIATQCATATKAAAAAATRLARSKTRLQRATNRLRRVRFSGRQARSTARALHRKAQARVREEKKALSGAEAAQQPWCSIPS